MKREITILGIETSCDETAAALVGFDGKRLKVLSNAVASQVEIHKLTGGVIPEVAAREHVTTIMPTIELALHNANLQNSMQMMRTRKKVSRHSHGPDPSDRGSTIENRDFAGPHYINGIAVTAGPGLAPALMVGVDTANALSLATGIPVIPVQHITGHIYANFLDSDNNDDNDKKKSYRHNHKSPVDITKIKFPLLALIVSGGHTEFILMTDYLKFKKVGQTLDDAAGEAFDKTGRLLGLPYPAGPHISKEAEKGDANAFNFPRPMIHDQSLNFSFAGLKTSVLYKVQELRHNANLQNNMQMMRTRKKISRHSHGPDPSDRGSTIENRDFAGPHYMADLAASIQEAIVDTLVSKTEQALFSFSSPPARPFNKFRVPERSRTGGGDKEGVGAIKSFTLGGGVAANKLLRERLELLLQEKFPDIDFYPTQIQYATDNAAMIGAVGAVKFWKREKLPRFAGADPQWEI